ncbi:hyaluronidase Tab y 2.0101-like [Sitodiplosis mosellana]|uniref:hyaluronidase Tab y 2.0101-like n=1 Tax=Sitodiplosis mosellana TaxID=263140 RepID=UPI002443E7E6|nr:hyaluronidase Tab y 2.0101-like [Sitodiplosis mosellana]XP_055318700.1 hyaluronidase Tab y 2.0101-like [Sitodiplosis mosellana]
MRSSHIRITVVIQFFVYNWFAVALIDAKPFTLYWNIPSFMCRQFKLPPINVTEKYGIVQNEDDAFRGSAISILYDPGKFPALLENSSSRALVQRNGGVPQQGNLNEHLQVFQKHVNELVPNSNNDGLAIIDFESWRPVYRQNFGTLQPYRDLSEQIERKRHPLMPNKRIEAEATRNFEKAGRTFIESSIDLARKMRPRAKWGYYGLPYCFNSKGTSIEDCPREVKEENNRTQWIYDASDVIYPSVYMTEQILPNDRARMVRGRVKESIRLARRSRNPQKPRVIAYFRYVFTDTKKYLNQKDTYEALNTVKSIGGDGVVLWGSSFDLNTKSKCVQFYDYLENVLGPIAQSFQPRYYVDGV